MPRRRLTDRFCDRVKADQQTDYFDEAMTGLALRVSPTKKVWMWLYTGPDGKRKRLTFGTFPAISLAAARGKVELMRSQIEAGLPPKAETFKAMRRISEKSQSPHQGRPATHA